MREWKSNEFVFGERITDIVGSNGQWDIVVVGGEVFAVTDRWVNENEPQIGGYLFYAPRGDGLRDVWRYATAERFESKFREVSRAQEPTLPPHLQRLPFARVLSGLEQDRAYRRDGWPESRWIFRRGRGVVHHLPDGSEEEFTPPSAVLLSRNWVEVDPDTA